MGAIAFHDVTLAAGLPRASQLCMAFRDFNNDGRPDLLLSPTDLSGGRFDGLVLYLNEAPGTFRPVPIPLPVDRVRTCAVADMDGDGLQDIAVSGDRGREGCAFVLRQEGGATPTFRDVLGAGCVAGEVPFVYAWLDDDGDGLLDLLGGYFFYNLSLKRNPEILCTSTPQDFACRLSPDPPHRAPDLLRNRATGGFDRTSTSLLAGFTSGLLPIDWNTDGRVDVFQTNDWGVNGLFLRGPTGAYENALPSMGGEVYNHGMNAVIADFDRDGRWDVYVADIGPDQLWFSRPDGRLEDRAASLGIAAATDAHSCWGPAVGDLDNDGLPDIVVPNAVIFEERAGLADGFRRQIVRNDDNQFDLVFQNTRGGPFRPVRVPHREYVVGSQDFSAAALADYDLDGRLDLALVTAVNTYEFRLLHNITPVDGRHWIDVRLQGRSVARDAVGATVVLRDGAGVEFAREPLGVGGLASSERAVHVGLGSRTTVGSLQVHWPGGATQVVPGPLTVDRTLIVEQR